MSCEALARSVCALLALDVHVSLGQLNARPEELLQRRFTNKERRLLKLCEARPDTLARASRLPGMTPAAISLLLITLKKRGMLKLQQG